ncbi:MAG TPA: CPBP family intramembrane glutamic endopeptidase [Luteolibacter sp.]|nr:CPBP family intramembrane glutamic endopeptidase [Luteolibacter sp.]
MSDPTYPVLALGFGAVLLICLAGIAARRSNPADPNGPPRLDADLVATWFYRPVDLIGPLLLWLFWGAMIGLQALQDLGPKFMDADGLLTAQETQFDAAKITAPALLVNIALQIMLAGAASAVVLRNCTPNQWLGLKWSRWPLVFVIAPAAVLGVWAVFLMIDLSGYMKWIESMGVEPLQDTVKLLRDCKDPIVLGLLAFTAVIIAPTCEELVFRGYLYPILKKYAGFWPALIASSLLFGLAHGSLASLLPLCLLGGLLAALYERTGSIWVPVAIHFCFNGATVAIHLLARAFDLPLPSGT